MSISVYCEHCEGTFKVQDKRAGKKVYCKLCNAVVKVPKPSAMKEVEVAEDSDEIVFTSSDDNPSADLDAFADLTPPPQSRVRPPARKQPRQPSDDSVIAISDDAFADLTPLPRSRVTPAARKKPRRRSTGMSWSLPSSSWMVAPMVVVAGLIIVGFITVQIFPRATISGILVLMMGAAVFLSMLAGFVLMVVGGLGLIISAFEEDTTCGLLYLFVPFYSLYYLVTRWDETRYPKFVAYGFLLSLGPPFLLVCLDAVFQINPGGLAPVRAPQGFGQQPQLPLDRPQNFPAGQPPGPAAQPLPNEEALRNSRPVGDTVLKAGDAVLIQWGARWWRGHVVSIQPDGKFKVHYTGWPDVGDEVVILERIRIPNP